MPDKVGDDDLGRAAGHLDRDAGVRRDQAAGSRESCR